MSTDHGNTRPQAKGQRVARMDKDGRVVEAAWHGGWTTAVEGIRGKNGQSADDFGLQ